MRYICKVSDGFEDIDYEHDYSIVFYVANQRWRGYSANNTIRISCDNDVPLSRVFRDVVKRCKFIQTDNNEKNLKLAQLFCALVLCLRLYLILTTHTFTIFQAILDIQEFYLLYQKTRFSQTIHLHLINGINCLNHLTQKNITTILL